MFLPQLFTGKEITFILQQGGILSKEMTYKFPEIPKWDII